MHNRLLPLSAAALALVLALGSSTSVAQDGTKKDMKAAGHETKEAAIDTGHGVTTGTKKAYHKTKRGTVHAYHKTKHALTPHHDDKHPQ